MIGTLLKVGIGAAAVVMLKPETRQRIGDAVRAIGKDYADLVRKEADDLKRFWREEVAPVLKGTDKGTEPPKPDEPPRGEGPKPPPEASA